MEEKRRFNRWDWDNKAYVGLKGKKEEVKVIDISIGGMRIITDTALDRTESFKGEFKILPNMEPFFIKGKVIWTQPKGGLFESGIVFDKVSTIALD